MINENFIFVANNLAKRNNARLKKKKRSPKELEVERFYYWILSQFEDIVQSTYPAKTTYKVTAREYFYRDEEKVLLKCNNFSQYLSGINRSEFYEVMQEVAQIFREIGKEEKCNPHFTVMCIAIDGSAEIMVQMTTN